MALTGFLLLSPSLGICRSQERGNKFKEEGISFCWRLTYRHVLQVVKTATVALTRSCNALQGSPLVTKLVPAVGIIIFTLWGLGPLMRMSRNVFLRKTDGSWRRSTTNYVMTSYLQPILLWTGAILICRSLDPIAMPTETSQLVKQRLVTFVKSLSTVLALAYCLSSVIQQAQKYMMEASDPSDARKMGFEFVGKALYTAVWVAAVSLFMELLGFSTQRWLTAGGLGTVLLTLAGREIFTNFLSSVMIHATRPFVVNEWIQTKIEGYEVSGSVEHVGWWSPTIIRGEDREAVHIPNHQFTVNVVRNLSQKTHWRIKTHLAISHLDVSKINNIVADMRKVLAKNPQVEQQKLHRRVFLENINPENQALQILVSCFVKTSHFEEYLCVKEAILLDLLRVISHHRARLATPIRTIHKFHNEPDVDSMSFSESFFTRGGPASKRPVLLIEPPYKINGEDKSKSQARTARTSAEKDGRGTGQPTADHKTDDIKLRGTSLPELNTKETSKSGSKADSKVVETSKSESRDESRTPVASKIDQNVDDKSSLMSNSNTPADLASSEIKTTGFTVSGNALKNPENIQQYVNTQTHVTEDKTSGSAAGSQSKQVEKSGASGQPKSTPTALEENIVLGVALGGSKRTLPIEEELDSPPNPAEVKELATRANGSGNSAAEKGEKDN